MQSSLHGTGAPNGNAAGERILSAALLLVAFAVGFMPLVRWLHGRAAPLAVGPAPPVRRIAGAALAGLLLAVGCSAAAPAGWSSLQVGGEVGLFLALFGIGAGSVFALLDRGRAPAASRSSIRRSIAVTCYAVLAIGVPIGSGLAEPVPHGPRWWWAPLVVGGCAMACCAAELLTLRLRGARRDVVRAAVLGTALLGILAAAIAGFLPSFVLLVAPLLGVLLLWHLAWTAVLARTARRGGCPRC